jgi:ADP-ribosyl-[dinitrogen reductase] hydrolase
MTGGWDRDLQLDLRAVSEWGASLVVTLIEDHEFTSLGVAQLGVEVINHHLDWLHLPIADASTPGGDFENAWAEVGEGIRARLRAGFNVVVHCKGGLGRAGTVAARLLVELGQDPDEAISAVRAARPGAIETGGQAGYVRSLKTLPELQPSTSIQAIRDRARGALLGLAIGDAVGTTLEFKTRDQCQRLTDMVGGGPFGLRAGQWTDDTAMALALADSLLDDPSLSEEDVMQRFVSWHEKGTYSCTGRCFDVGITTRQALERWKCTGNPIAGSTDPMSAGNGSLMRLSAVAVRHFGDRPKLRDVAARQSRTTHAAPEAVDACVVYAEMLADAIEGRPRTEVLRARQASYSGKIAQIALGSWRGLPRDNVKSSGYVAHSLEASLWSVGRTASFEGAVLLAANLADDADTTAAITGQLAGALYGEAGMPAEWKAKVAWEKRITETADALVRAGSPSAVAML